MRLSASVCVQTENNFALYDVGYKAPIVNDWERDKGHGWLLYFCNLLLPIFPFNFFYCLRSTLADRLCDFQMRTTHAHN